MSIKDLVSVKNCPEFLSFSIERSIYHYTFAIIKLINLQTVIDAIKHNIMFEKLNPSSSCEDTINWFQSYLTDRSFIADSSKK